MVLNDRLPMKLLLTHGFVVDDKGLKMSKSRGNVVDPLAMIKKYGADVLRLWVASVDYESDVSISPKMLDQVAENYRKLRNTCRFLLANLYDFNPAQNAIDLDDMCLLDRYAVNGVNQLNAQVQKLYGRYAFAQVVQVLTRYCTVELSQQYLDVSKDRLYVERADSHARRSAQTAQYHILEVLMRLLAPIMVYTTEDVHMHIPYKKNVSSVHQLRFADTTDAGGVSSLWDTLHSMREHILRAIEQQRAQGVIKHSLEAAVVLNIASQSDTSRTLDQLAAELGEQTVEQFFKEWLIVSSCTITPQPDTDASSNHGFGISVKHADGVKCPRCWHWSVSEHEDGLCARCQDIV